MTELSLHVKIGDLVDDSVEIVHETDVIIPELFLDESCEVHRVQFVMDDGYSKEDVAGVGDFYAEGITELDLSDGEQVGLPSFLSDKFLEDRPGSIQLGGTHITLHYEDCCD